jgi:hypothetical protein
MRYFWIRKMQKKSPPLSEGLLTALRALDNQIAREMQRSPEQQERSGVQKWEPIQKRVELVCALLLNALGERQIALDGIVVLAQAMPKALLLLTQDLGEEGLGKLRTAYCNAAFESIQRDAEAGARMLKDDQRLV